MLGDVWLFYLRLSLRMVDMRRNGASNVCGAPCTYLVFHQSSWQLRLHVTPIEALRAGSRVRLKLPQQEASPSGSPVLTRYFHIAARLLPGGYECIGHLGGDAIGGKLRSNIHGKMSAQNIYGKASTLVAIHQHFMLRLQHSW
jgi:hypothetical protein